MKNLNFKEIGKRIKSERKKQGISQEELCNQAGITQGFLSSIENGNKSFSVYVANQICCVLNITIEYLLYGKKIVYGNFESDVGNALFLLICDNRIVRVFNFKTKENDYYLNPNINTDEVKIDKERLYKLYKIQEVISQGIKENDEFYDERKEILKNYDMDDLPF